MSHFHSDGENLHDHTAHHDTSEDPALQTEDARSSLNHDHKDIHDHDIHDNEGHDNEGDRTHGHSTHEHSHGDGTISRLLSFVAHSHAEEDELNSPVVTSREGVRALQWSLIGLGITAAIQISVVALSGSVALLSDSIHNFADALTAIPLGIAFVVGKKKANSRYTYGYGRAEDLAGIVIVAIITASTLIALYEALSRLVSPQGISNIPLVIVAGLVGFAGNELVAVYRIRVGKKIGSAALTADGLHARSDGLASLAVVVGAIGVALGFKLADPIASLFIGVAVVSVLRQALREIYRRLMDSVDPAMVETVKRVLLATPGVDSVETVRLRWIGHDLRAEVDILSDATLTLIESHAISELAHHNLLHQLPRLAEAVIHTSPRFSTLDETEYAHRNIAHHFPK